VSPHIELSDCKQRGEDAENLDQEKELRVRMAEGRRTSQDMVRELAKTEPSLHSNTFDLQHVANTFIKIAVL
jgi:hypothetical protein